MRGRARCRFVIWASAPTHFDNHVVKTLEQTADELGIARRHTVSGAGHDAKYMTSIAPTAMIFVRMPDGQGHCPEEKVEWTDARDAVRLLLHVVLQLAG
jgi:N-carbamoyl-L-amino-acid hydrolase